MFAYDAIIESIYSGIKIKNINRTKLSWNNNRLAKVGIVSKSGTLTYEAANKVVKSGYIYGISTAIGGDTIIGTSMKSIVSEFFNDSETDIIVMIGDCPKRQNYGTRKK